MSNTGFVVMIVSHHFKNISTCTVVQCLENETTSSGPYTCYLDFTSTTCGIARPIGNKYEWKDHLVPYK